MINYIPKIALLHSEIKIIKMIVYFYLPNSKVIIFGSRVKGLAKRFSDIDILIDNKEEIRLDIVIKIHEEISLNIEYLIDLLDITKISDEFKKIVLQTGIQI
jgi:predicted nucleotidyltransferase